MGVGRGVYRILVGNLRERGQWGNPGVDVSIILRLIFLDWNAGVWTGSSWLRIGQVAVICGFGNESSGGIKCRGFLD